MTTMVEPKPKGATSSAAKKLRRGQRMIDTHAARAPADSLDGAMPQPIPKGAAPRQPLPTGQKRRDAHISRARGDKLVSDHRSPDAHGARAADELLFCAEYLDDVERVRIATENRLRSMVEDGIDAGPYMQQVLAFQRIEHEATLALQRVLRRHPLGSWVKTTKGVGEKQAARLIAAIGSVSYNHLEDRPRRGPAELWAYCGYVPGQKRRKGVGGKTGIVGNNWNATAKSRSYVIAESMLKAGNRAVYDRARAHKAGFVHDKPCQICAGKGKPAESAIGQPWKDGHAHEHALRLTAKEMLKGLFLEARRVGA